MTSESEQTPTSVQANWTYTSTDTRSYRELVSRRWHAYGSDIDDPFYFRYIVAALCILAGLAAFFVGAVPNLRNPTVPLLCGVVYYTARTIEDLLIAQRYRRTYKRALEELERRPYQLDIDHKGVLFIGPHERYTIEWPRIFAVRLTKGLLLFWLGERDAVYVPTRAFAGSDLEKARAIATRHVTPKPKVS